MAWEDVPAKLAAYAANEYAKFDAVQVLYNEYGVTDYTQIVSEPTRALFEEDIDYRLGAVTNLSKSVAWDPKRMKV